MILHLINNNAERLKEMKSLRKITVVLVLAVLAGSLTVMLAQSKNNSVKSGLERGAGVPPPRGAFHPRLLEQLNLTDGQKTQFRELHENARAASEQHFTALNNARTQLKAVVEGASFNEEQARQILAAKNQAETELEIIRLRTDSAVYNLLTAEQKAKLVELEQQRPMRGGKGRRGDIRPDAPPPAEN